MRPLRYLVVAALSGGLALGQPAGPIITFNNDGGWCWFQDERVIVHQGKLIIGSVAAGAHQPDRAGDIEVLTYELATGARVLSELHDRMDHGLRVRYDDHNSPALLVRPDGRILAVYSRHGQENRFHFRITEAPHDPTRWQPERTFVPSQTSSLTYSNLHWLASENGGRGRLYDFFRGLDATNKPSYVYSDDLGETWKTGNVFIDVPAKFRHRPYVKYASNGADTVHVFYTEGHPRDFDNSAYHVFYRAGRLYRSDGTLIRALAEGLREPAEGSRVFAGDPDNVAWVSDIHLDRQGRPYVAYSVQKGSAGLPPGQGGMDHRYRYARWTGKQWVDREIAFAGTRLYAGEDDYTGNLALDPDDPNAAYISTNADPVTGAPLISRADGRPHWEIFQGVTPDGGAKWSWSAVTRDSTADNIRPVVPMGAGNRLILLWLRGRYTSYTNYDLDVVGIVPQR